MLFSSKKRVIILTVILNILAQFGFYMTRQYVGTEEMYFWGRIWFVVSFLFIFINLAILVIFIEYSARPLEREITELEKAILLLQNFSKQLTTGTQQVLEAVNQITIGAESQSDQIRAVSEL